MRGCRPGPARRICFCLYRGGGRAGEYLEVSLHDGVQGGGAFVLIYLASIFAIAIPIAAAELVVGRQAQ